MSNCYIESRLERLALEQLANPAMEQPKHMTECQFCNATFMEYISFYVHVNEQMNSVKAPELAEKIQEKLQLDEGSTYRLDSLHLLPEIPAGHPYSHNLAADSVTTSKTPIIHNMGVFTSSDQRLMVRLLKDMDESYSLFLVSESPELCQHALVTLLGYEREYVSDSNGYINLGEVELPAVTDLGIEVRSARETITLQPSETELDSLTETRETLNKYSVDRQYKVEVVFRGHEFTLKVKALDEESHATHGQVKVMLVKDNVCLGLKILESGKAQFHGVEDITDLHVKIFI